MTDAQLKKRRSQTKGSLTRLKNGLTDEFLAEANLATLQVREQRVLELFAIYTDLMLKIEDDVDPEDPTSTEECYYHCLSLLRTEIKKKENSNDGPHSGAGVGAQIKLPNINIPEFSGNYLEFRPFIELFTALIHDDKKIPEIQKLMYLRNFLTDEAYNLIKNLPVQGSSYSEALHMIKERYDNSHKIVQEHITLLLEMNPLGKSTVASLRSFISSAKQHVAALKNLNQPVEHWDSILVCILSRKLDQYTNRAYCLDKDSSQPHTFTGFIKYLEDRALALESSEYTRGTTQSPGNQPKRVVYNEQKVTNVTIQDKNKCLYCGKHEHKLFLCPSFSLINSVERNNFVNNKKLCKVCLNSHSGKCRYHFKCTHCKQNHNTLLHSAPTTKEQEKENVALISGFNKDLQVLLPTALVKVISQNGEKITARALLDSGSQSCFITSDLAKRLGRQLNTNNINIKGIGSTEHNINNSLQLDIHSCAYPFKTNVNCLVVDKITSNLPQQKFNPSLLKIPQNIKLADIHFNETSPIDILLDAGVFFQALLPQSEEQCKQSSDPALPRIIATSFGYVVAGNLPNIFKQPPQNAAVSLFCQECDSEISSTINKFWQSEAVPEIFTEHTSEQTHCEQYFKDTVKLIDNKFEVSMPLKIPIYDVNNTLGDSLHLALRRFLNLEKRLHKDQALFEEYQSFVQEYIDLGHASYIDITSYDLSKDAVYFMPHHPIIRENAVSTRLRTVFDGSMKTSNKISLNDILLNGPVVQPELFEILLLFRMNTYFFTCDIKRMFRNISVEQSQRSLQNILWRNNPQESIKCLQLNTVTYGLKPSSFLATRCLNELADRFKNEYKLACPVIMQSCYIDDILFSHNDLNTIIQTKKQLIELLSKGSFTLHKWSANNDVILQDIPESSHYSGEIGERQHDIKTLGLNFNINLDSFVFSPPPKQSITTKREILAFISKFYDPLGLLGPIFIKAKHIMQQLWLTKTDWDAIPSKEIQQEWQLFYDQLTQMSPIQVKRNIFSDNNIKKFQLIGFSDASTIAHGCSIYIRMVNSNNEVKMSLLCSKSRINPANKILSMPRLELNAALLLAKLMSKVHSTIKQTQDVNKVYLFTDSQVVLAWLRTQPIHLNTYVANRIKFINEYTKNFSWTYIPTEENPADCLSRGVNPEKLSSHKLWWSASSSFLNPNYNFDKEYDLPVEIPETKARPKEKVVCAASLDSQHFLSSFVAKFSNLVKAQNVLSYVIRFCQNAKAKTDSDRIKENFITHTESKKALQMLITNEQHKFFSEEFHLLRKNKEVHSNLKSLNPFIDKQGLLRVGGRLQHADLSYDQKHQVILPKDSQLTRLIIENEHKTLLHASQKLVLSSLNQRYWITNGLRIVKSVIHKCIVCFRFKAVTSKQLMGSLPADRVNFSKPFQKVGIDFAGPIQVKQSTKRSVLTSKGYIAVYVCFATKAIHLELVSDLTTNTFLASFKRFVSRRNIPQEVYCDNAGTFKSASKLLTELYNLNNSNCHRTQVQSAAAQMGVNFHFIPSYSPVFGGLWEAAVKSVKYHLKRALGSHILTYEQLYTVLVQIEGVLNSRPLLPMSSDVNDTTYLTPGHFLTGAALNSIPERDISNAPENRLKFWQKCTAIQQQFWKQWSKQYLNNLQNRPKWKESHPNVKVGDLVILKEFEQPPMSWPMARVTQVFPGADGKVRAMEVIKANGRSHKTSITKVCLLPLD